MADPLAGTDTYDILSGLSPRGSENLPQMMRQWARMDMVEAAQVNWAERTRWLLNEASYEIERLRGAHG